MQSLALSSLLYSLAFCRPQPNLDPFAFGAIKTQIEQALGLPPKTAVVGDLVSKIESALGIPPQATGPPVATLVPVKPTPTVPGVVVTFTGFPVPPEPTQLPPLPPIPAPLPPIPTRLPPGVNNTTVTVGTNGSTVVVSINGTNVTFGANGNLAYGGPLKRSRVLAIPPEA